MCRALRQEVVESCCEGCEGRGALWEASEYCEVRALWAIVVVALHHIEGDYGVKNR